MTFCQLWKFLKIWGEHKVLSSDWKKHKEHTCLIFYMQLQEFHDPLKSVYGSLWMCWHHITNSEPISNKITFKICVSFPSHHNVMLFEWHFCGSRHFWSSSFTMSSEPIYWPQKKISPSYFCFLQTVFVVLPCSLSLVSNDFWLFSKLQTILKGFQSV